MFQPSSMPPPSLRLVAPLQWAQACRLPPTAKPTDRQHGGITAVRDHGQAGAPPFHFMLTS